MSDDQRFERGLEIRREVLSADHVERSLANATDFTRPLQELVTECCWGTVWNRPGLERRTRSLITIAVLTALNQQHELGLHVEGARRNGCTDEEIREALLHVAVYCGIPAGVAAFRTAQPVLEAVPDTETVIAGSEPSGPGQYAR